MSNQKARQAVIDALNGRAEAVDPAVKHALMALSTVLDDMTEDMERHVADIRADQDRHANESAASIRSLRNAVTAAAGTVVAASIGVVMTVLIS